MIQTRNILKSYFEKGDKPTQQQFEDLIDSMVHIEELSSLENLTHITYNQLVTTRGLSKLIPGRFYRITDYSTTTIQSGTESAGHQFDVIVLALTGNTLSERAWACHHEGDTYFQNSNLAAWQIWYCIDNDTSRFAWADTNSGKGVIYRMIDEYNNDCPYDFKNIRFNHPLDTEDSNMYFTFSQVVGDSITDKSLQKSCNRNVVKSYKPNDVLTINKNLFLNTTDTSFCNNNLIGSGSRRNVFGNSSSRNVIGEECYDNNFGSDCKSNTFGNFVQENVFVKNTHANHFGHYIYRNTFKENVNVNTIGNNFYDNVIGSNFNRNLIGNAFYSNTIGANADSNTFGNNCYSNTFGSYLNSNTFGNTCYSNTFGNSCFRNRVQSYCRFISLGSNCFGNIFGEGCAHVSFRMDASADSNLRSYCQFNQVAPGVLYLVIYNKSTASENNKLQGIRVGFGVSGTSTSSFRAVEVAKLNATYESKVARDSSGAVKVYCEED